MALTQTIVYEESGSDRIYLIAPVSPIEPSPTEIEEYAYGAALVADAAKGSPNQFIKWYGGHYVEADNPNGNGAMWTAAEIAMKAVTPRLMPVTVMHEPSTAVGVIADVALRLPPAKPRPSLETALALWAHRYPEVIEEAMQNYENGSLMQSMECLAPAYDCGECGQGFLKLPGGAERGGWCEHLKSPTGVRILRATTFTGTGLIFGTRGASGADPLAHLEDFKQEVAEFHQRGVTHQVSKRTSPRSKPTMELDQDKYDALMARPTREEFELLRAQSEKAVKDFEQVETENVALRKQVEDKDQEIASFKEQANQATLRGDRMAKLGDKFLGALGEKTRTRLTDQAATMEDAEWADRLSELAELVKVEPDAKGDGTTPPPATGAGAPAATGTPTFSAEEVARQGIGGASQELGLTAPATVTRGVIAGLVTRTKSTPAAK